MTVVVLSASPRPGVVRGVGNRRGEVRADPSDPLGAAHELGRTLLERHHSDYTVASVRSGAVWG